MTGAIGKYQLGCVQVEMLTSPKPLASGAVSHASGERERTWIFNAFAEELVIALGCILCSLLF